MADGTTSSFFDATEVNYDDGAIGTDRSPQPHTTTAASETDTGDITHPHHLLLEISLPQRPKSNWSLNLAKMLE
ncbi:hypothetical protein L917_17666 [Phytophthora nicotianae]|uniref:Uncharacterized protein n=1 Tax=Phytophthora nicotianae TaxID=4792 RepID=W2KAF6_PHYNI|nr:hypothetical protein L917_17666 [Phytophthora nicotianae]